MRGHAENIRDILSCINRLWIWATTGQLWKQTPWNLFEDVSSANSTEIWSMLLQLTCIAFPRLGLFTLGPST